MTTPTTLAAPFGVRLRAAMDAHGPLCAGIDPHRGLVESWGLPFTYDGVERFAMTCVEAFGGRVAAVKPQSAFFEVFGSRGVALLERVTAELHDAGTLVVLDVKRGDIGSTMQAYGEAFVGADAPEPVDAITLSPYLGYESLRPAIDLALAGGRGVFVLALTSNPEGASVQHARTATGTVAGDVVAGAARDNADAIARGELGSVGLVVGATIGSAAADLGIDLASCGGPFLAPGVGAQGGTPESVRAVFGDAVGNVLASSSREVLSAGPDVAALAARAVATAERLADALG